MRVNPIPTSPSMLSNSPLGLLCPSCPCAVQVSHFLSFGACLAHAMDDLQELINSDEVLDKCLTSSKEYRMLLSL
jgi:hypothetical protein